MRKTCFCFFIHQRSETVALECLSAAHSSSKSGRFPPFRAARRRRRSRPPSPVCIVLTLPPPPPPPPPPSPPPPLGGRSVCKLGQLCVWTELQLCVGPVRGWEDLYADNVPGEPPTAAAPWGMGGGGSPLCVLSPARCSESRSHRVRRVDGACTCSSLLHLFWVRAKSVWKKCLCQQFDHLYGRLLHLFTLFSLLFCRPAGRR